MLGLLVFALTGCNANLSPYAAKVGKATIEPGTLNAAMASVARDHGYRCLLGGGQEVPARGAGEDTYSAVFASSILTDLVRSEIVQQEVARRGLPLPQSARAIAVGQLQATLTSELGSQPSCAASMNEVWSQLGRAYRDELVSYQAAEDAIAAATAGTSLRPSDLARYAAAHPKATSDDCISVIETRSRAAALKAKAEIARGTTFAAVAKKSSIDPTSAAAGGSIGCVAAGQLVAPLSGVVAALTPGVVSNPVKYQTSYLLLLVTSRQTEPDSAIVAQIFAGTGSLQSVMAALKRTDVVVASAYGRWSVSPKTLGLVLPPTRPPARFTPTAGL